MMRYVTAFVLVSALAFPASAAFTGPGAEGGSGGFAGPGPQGGITQAAQVKDAKDDAPVKLEGTLVERLHKDKYTFRDASGTVVVDIDRKDFRGQTVTPETKIRIYGEVDAKWNRENEVDVDRLEVIR